MHPIHDWLTQFPWKWIQNGKMFKFLGIPFAFQASPTQLWSFVVQKVEKKLSYWATKKLSLAGKFHICSKILASTHVYYSSCWVPSKNCYQKLDRLLRDFIWASNVNKRGFHRVAWEICYLPHSAGGMGLFNYQFQGYALCAKWILRALEGQEAWKLLVQHCILQGLLLGKKFAPINIKISGSFVIKSIWKAWESLKP